VQVRHWGSQLILLICTATTGSYYVAPPAAPHGHAVSIPVVLTGAANEAPTTLGIADSTLYTLSDANGDATLKIWATEYGLPTNYPITQTQQAAFIHDFVVAWQDVEGAGPMFIYTTRDSYTGGFDDEQNFGLFKTNWTPKLAVATVEELIQELASGTLQPFDATPYANKIDFLGAAVIVIRQLISLVAIVPKALYQIAVSAVTAVTHVIGSALGIATAAASRLAAATPPAAKAAAVQPNRKGGAQAAPRVKPSAPAAAQTSDKKKQPTTRRPHPPSPRFAIPPEPPDRPVVRR
jgi:hypothetical protein